jgi:hypothetical protein
MASSLVEIIFFQNILAIIQLIIIRINLHPSRAGIGSKLKTHKLIDIIAQIINIKLIPFCIELLIKSTIHIGHFTCFIASVLCSGVSGVKILTNNNLIHLNVRIDKLNVSFIQYVIESKNQYLYLKSQLSLIFSHKYAQIFHFQLTFSGIILILIFCFHLLISKIISLSGLFDIFLIKSFIFFSHNSISFCRIQYFEAILHSTGLIFIQSFFINNHILIDCSYVGIKCDLAFVSILVLIQIGLIHIINIILKIKLASIKFIKTQAKIIIDCCHIGLLNNAGCSQYNLTNQPIGSQFKENRVHFLSTNNFLALGGIHNQNSSTFTQNFLAEAKCHHSCIKIIIENIIIDTIIQIIIIFDN